MQPTNILSLELGLDETYCACPLTETMSKGTPSQERQGKVMDIIPGWSEESPGVTIGDSLASLDKLPS